MNVFNRAVVIVEILLLIVLLIIAAVVPNTTLDRVLYTAQQAKSALEMRWPMSYVLFLLVDIALIFLLVGLLWLQLRPTTKKTVRVRNVAGAEVEISTASVEQSLQYRIGEIADVLRVRPTVRGKRGGVEIVVDLETTPEIDVPAKTAEVSQAARDVVESKMGLKVAGIKVHIRHAPYGKGKAPAPVAPPAAEPSVSWEPVAPTPTEEPAPPPPVEPPTIPEQ